MKATVKRVTGLLGGAALVFAVTGGLVMAAGTGVLPNSLSNFESGDGNMVLDTTGDTDWNCFVNSDNFAKNGTTPTGCKVTSGAKQVTADANGEITWVNGQKFDTQCPALQTGNVPNKDDFLNIAEFSDVNSTTLDTFLYGRAIRATANGNASGDVELNSNPTGSNGTTSAGCRQSGDRLIAYDFLNGGTSLDFHVLTWIISLTDTSGGNNQNGITGCFVKTDSPPCWGAAVIHPTDSTLFNGQANQAAITAANNGISNVALVAQQFAEFGVNLTQILGLGGKCFSFPQQVWESRSSGSSFTSNPEDIEFENLTINNCGEIKVIKQTDPRGIDQSFSFTSTIPSTGTSCTQSTSSSFTLNDTGNTGKTLGSTDPAQNSSGNTQDCTNVPQGSYTVTEGAEPGGFTFESLTCTADSTSGSSVTKSGETATITLKPLGVVTCLYVNQQNTATLATQVSTTTAVFPGTSVTDTATVTGNQATITPTGTVTFYLCSAGTIPCSSGGTSIGTGTLSGSGAVATATSPAVNTSASPLGAGTYCFRAQWPGDTNYPTALTEYGGANGTNECFTVQQIKTTTVTTPSAGQGGTATFGSSVTDSAVITALQSGGGSITGTVTFYVCNPSQTSGGACPDPKGTLVSSTTTLTDLGTTPPSASASSTGVTVNQTGTWCFRAVYTPGGTNGANYIGSSDASSTECFTVTDTTASTSAQTWLPNDTGTVASANGAPLNGTLSIQLYTGGTCALGSEVSGQLYTKTLTNATSAADRTLTTSNTSFAVSTSSSVSWLVSFTSSDPNVSSSSHCESTSLTISN